MSREAILKSMLTGVSPVLSDAQMKSIAVVMNAFSGKQLEIWAGWIGIFSGQRGIGLAMTAVRECASELRFW